MRSHKGTERSASRRWLRITFACLGLIAVFVGTASALTVEYTISTYAATSGTGTGSCVSGIFVTSCGFFGYSNSDLPPSVGFPPLPSLTFGVDNPVEQTAIAKQFPAMVASGAFADF